MARVRTQSIAALSALVGLSLVAGSTATWANPSSGNVAPVDLTSAEEAKRVDSVPLQDLKWGTCERDTAGDARLQCATMAVPINYDKPDGPKMAVYVSRFKGSDPAKRQGNLILVEESPESSGVLLLPVAAEYFSPEVVQSFDLYSVDFRGGGYGDQMYCFPNNDAEEAVLQGFRSAFFPMSASEWTKAIDAASQWGPSCAQHAGLLGQHMSSTESARDIEVLRRTLNEGKANVFGVGAGTFAANVYANMFPDRVRTVSGEGSFNPDAYRGTPGSKVPPLSRIGADANSLSTLRRILKACDKAGKAQCKFAGEDGFTKVRKDADALKTIPLVGHGDDEEAVFGYVEYVDFLSTVVQFPGMLDVSMEVLQSVHEALAKAPGSVEFRAASPGLRAAVKDFKAKGAAGKGLLNRVKPGGVGVTRSGLGEPLYDNAFDVRFGSQCADAHGPVAVSDWLPIARAAEAKTPLFGVLRSFERVTCAEQAWTHVAPSARFAGSFDKRMENRPLWVAAEFSGLADPKVTSAGARAQGAFFLRVDGALPEAYQQSACARTVVDAYLLTGKTPKGDQLVCTDGAAYEFGPGSRGVITP